MMKKKIFMRLVLAIFIVVAMMFIGVLIGVYFLQTSTDVNLIDVTEKTHAISTLSMGVQLVCVGAVWLGWESLIVSRGKNAKHVKYLRYIKNPLCLSVGAVLLVLMI
jgi:magnesium-transporting ATPase (P-type)